MGFRIKGRKIIHLIRRSRPANTMSRTLCGLKKWDVKIHKNSHQAVTCENCLAVRASKEFGVPVMTENWTQYYSKGA